MYNKKLPGKIIGNVLNNKKRRDFEYTKDPHWDKYPKHVKEAIAITDSLAGKISRKFNIPKEDASELLGEISSRYDVKDEKEIMHIAGTVLKRYKK